MVNPKSVWAESGLTRPFSLRRCALGCARPTPLCSGQLTPALTCALLSPPLPRLNELRGINLRHNLFIERNRVNPNLNPPTCHAGLTPRGARKAYSWKAPVRTRIWSGVNIQPCSRPRTCSSLWQHSSATTGWDRPWSRIRLIAG